MLYTERSSKTLHTQVLNYIADGNLLDDGKCCIPIWTNGGAGGMSWLQMLEAVSSIASMCAAQGGDGMQDQLGELSPVYDMWIVV